MHFTLTQKETSRRERTLLLIAAAFLIVGTLTLAISNLALGIGHLALSILSFAISFAAAHIFLNRYLPHRDPLLLPVAALLTGWGLLLIGRLAINFLLRQTIWLLISTAALLIIVWLSRDLRWLRRFRYTWLFGGLALLAATLVLGVNPSGYGLRLWLGMWGIYFQPSELLKLLMIVYLASYLAERRELLVSERWRVWRWQLPQPAYVGPLLVMLGLAVAVYFIIHYDVADYPNKIEIIGRIGDAISGLFPKLFTFYSHPNVVAGFLGMLLPLALSLGPVMVNTSHEALRQAVSH